MKIFVTGGTGFIGQNTVKLLLESGHECNCLVRGSSNKNVLEEMGCQLVTGGITDKKSLTNGMARCDAVINLANLYSCRSVPQLEAINFCGFSVFIAMGGLLSTDPCNHLQKLCIPR